MAGIALGLCCLGCLLLSLSLRRHYRQVFMEETAYAQRRLPLRITGYLSLALAMWVCQRTSGVGIGICLWLSMVALAAFLQIMLLTYRPAQVTTFGCLGAMLIVAGLLL